MQLMAASRLSARMTETPEGYLICHDVPLANASDMLYAEAQVQSWNWTDYETGEPIICKDGLLNISRTTDMLFSPEVVASFNGKPLTRKHPPVMLKPGEIEHYQIGSVVNARPPKEGEMADHMYADLLVTHADGIAAVKAGGRGVSPGYDAKVKQVAPGLAEQHHLVGNHVAIDVEPRGGRTCQIGDEVMTVASADAETTAKAGTFDKLRELLTGEPAVKPVAQTFDSAAFKGELLGDVGKMLEPITAALAALKPAEPATPVMDAATTAAVDAKIAVIMPDLEVLKPGIAKPAATMDATIAAQRIALDAASVSHKDAITPLLAGRTVATMDAATLDTLVPAAAFVVRGANDLAVKRTSLAGLASVMAPTRDAANDINAKAAAAFGDARGYVS